MIAAIALLASFVLVPLGLVYGVVARCVLARRERRAGSTLPDALDGRALRASTATTGLQVADRRVTVGLLAIGSYLLVLTTVYDRLDAQGFVFGNTTALGRWLLAAGGVGLLGVGLVLVAIPLSAVIVTRRIRDREVLLGEAFALARRGGRPRLIRTQRVLSWIVFVSYAIAAVVRIVAALLPG